MSGNGNASPQLAGATQATQVVSKDPFSPESQKAQLLSAQGQEVMDRLLDCPKGFDGCQEFEAICHDILDLFIRESMESFNISTQATTWDKHQRMDIVVKNRPWPGNNSGYWSRLQAQLGADSILFECKNKEEGIGREEIYQTKDYQLEEFGKFRVILTREYPGSTAIHAIRHWFHYDPKVRIIVFTQDDLIRLVKAKIGEIEETVEGVFYSLEDDDRDTWYR